MQIHALARELIKVAGKTRDGSNFEGVKELASQIWFDQKETRLTMYSEKKADGFHNMHFLDKQGFYERNPKLNLNRQIFANNFSQETFESILETVKSYYKVGLLKEGFFSLRIQSSYLTKELKKEKALELFFHSFRKNPNTYL